MSQDFEKEVFERFNKIDKRFTKIDKRFTKIDGRFAKIDERFNKIDERIDKLDQRMDKTDERMDVIDKRLNNIEEIIEVIPNMNKTLLLLEDKITNELPALYEIYSLNYEIQKNNEKKIKSLLKTTSKHSIQIANLETSIKNHTSQIKKLIS